MEQTPPQQSLFIMLAHLYREGARMAARHLGLSLSRMEMLQELMHAGEISQAELQQRLGSEGSLITRYVKQMEADNIITRRADPKDNRFTLVKLTPTGIELIKKMQQFRDTYETRFMESLTEEERTIALRVMTRAYNAIAQNREAEEKLDASEK